MQHRALLDTLVLTESGARLELLEPDTQARLHDFLLLRVQRSGGNARLLRHMFAP